MLSKPKKLSSNSFNESHNQVFNDFGISNAISIKIANKVKLKRKTFHDSIHLVDNLINSNEANENVKTQIGVIDEIEINQSVFTSHEQSFIKRFKKSKITNNDDDQLLDLIELRDDNEANHNLKFNLNYKFDKNEQVKIQSIDEILQDKSVLNSLIINIPKCSLTNPKPKPVLNRFVYDAGTQNNQVEIIGSFNLEDISKQQKGKTFQKGTDWLNHSDLLSSNLHHQKADQQEDLLFHSQKNPKFTKNGFANQLKSLLEREKSAINFNKHLLKKDKLNKNSTVTVIPFKKETFFDFIFVIYATEIQSNESVILLLPKNTLYSGTFEKHINSKHKMHIYPPWHRVTLTIKNKTINAYYCVNLYKIDENDHLKNEQEEPLELNINLKDVKCNKCGQSSDCENYFDYNKLFHHADEEKADAPLANTQIALYSQLNMIVQSQDINFSNSILDSLEESGYFGNVSFQAVVQRVFQMKTKLSNIARRYALVSDKFNMFAKIHIPFDLEIAASFKYDFKCLKLIEKCVLKDNSSLDKQIAHLWSHLTKSQSNTKLNYPKTIYLFEFDFCTSRLESVGKSRAYVELQQIRNFDILLKEDKELLERYTMNNAVILLLNAIPLENASPEMNQQIYEIYFTDYKNDILKVQFNDLNRINTKILTKLSESFIVEADVNNFNFEKDVLIFDEFTIIEPASLSRNINNSLGNFLKPISLNTKTSDFVKITGKIMNIVENECFVILKCTNCEAINDLTAQENDQWFCNSCKEITIKPKVKLSMQLILNCTNLEKQVKLRPHFNTIRELLDVNEDEIHFNEAIFDVGSLIDKQIGPLYAFVYKTTDNEVYSKEILFCL